MAVRNRRETANHGKNYSARMSLKIRPSGVARKRRRDAAPAPWTVGAATNGDASCRVFRYAKFVAPPTPGER
jgi:hypothetical protein